MKARIGSCLALILMGNCVAGCMRGTAPLLSQAAPESYIGFDPISRKVEVHNSKDCDLKFEEAVLSKTGDDYSMTIRGFALLDTASSVRTANVAQIEAGGVAMERTLNGVGNIFSQLIGVVAASSFSAGKSGDYSQVQKIIDAASSLQAPAPQLPFPPTAPPQPEPAP